MPADLCDVRRPSGLPCPNSPVHSRLAVCIALGYEEGDEAIRRRIRKLSSREGKRMRGRWESTQAPGIINQFCGPTSLLWSSAEETYSRSFALTIAWLATRKCKCGFFLLPHASHPVSFWFAVLLLVSPVYIHTADRFVKADRPSPLFFSCLSLSLSSRSSRSLVQSNPAEVGTVLYEIRAIG